MDPEQEVVNQTESTPVEQPQQTEGQEAQVAAEENVQQESSLPQGKEAIEAVDESGIPYKNRYMEAQRKFAELSDNLPKMIEETLAKKQQAPQVQQEYTIEQLEQIALQNPNLRPQVEAEKAKLQEQKFARLIEERENKQQQRYQADMLRQQVWQEVSNDPVLKDAFTTNAMGQKQFRMDHPLTNIISDIMRSPELANRPDGLRIASDIAYGRYMRDVAANGSKQTRSLQAAVKKEQRKTLVESGSPTGSSGGDELQKAKLELARTGSKDAAQKAILAIMKKSGMGVKG